MTTELTILAWGGILGLVHIFAAVQFAINQYGMAWGTSSREEEMPPPRPIVGRMQRASKNFLETFPIAAAAILIVQAAGLNDRWTAIGAIVWLAARVIYLPVYALGITGVRTALFLISVVGIGMILWPALF